MFYTVTYRREDGTLARETLSGTSREDVLRRLRARGIHPVAVLPGPPARAASTRGRRRGIVCGSALVAVFCLVALWLFVRTDSAPERPASESPSREGTLPERTAHVQPAPRPTGAAVAVPSPVPGSPPRAVNAEEPPPGLLPNEPWRAGRRKIHKVQYVARNTNTVHRNATERMLLDVFSCEVGDPPLPLSGIPQEDLTNMWAILSSPNPVSEKDTEAIRVDKEILEAAKKELKKYLAEGGDIGDFFTHYHGVLEKAHKRRMLATEEIYKVIERGETDIAREMVRRVNRELRKDGISPLPIPHTLFQKEDSR